MENITIKEIEGQLHLVVDPSVRLGLSKSGKTTIVAKTGGYGQKILLPSGDNLTVSLNVYTDK